MLTCLGVVCWLDWFWWVVFACNCNWCLGTDWCVVLSWFVCCLLVDCLDLFIYAYLLWGYFGCFAAFVVVLRTLLVSLLD